MRLIDADALETHEMLEPLGNGQYREVLIVHKDDIDFAPEEPRKGKWVEGEYCDIMICSNCGKEAYWDTDYGQQLFDYCPYCGADMRGEK